MLQVGHVVQKRQPLPAAGSRCAPYASSQHSENKLGNAVFDYVSHRGPRTLPDQQEASRSGTNGSSSNANIANNKMLILLTALFPVLTRQISKRNSRCESDNSQIVTGYLLSSST